MEAALTAVRAPASLFRQGVCEPRHSPCGFIPVRNPGSMLEATDRPHRPLDLAQTIMRRADPDRETSETQIPTPILPQLAVVCLTGSVLMGCVAPIQYARPVHQDPTRAVTLEARYGYGQDGEAFRFTHPFVLTEAQWDRILSRVQIQRRNWVVQIGARSDGPSPAFRDDERRYLARQLTTAFTRARPDEWVLFYLSRATDSGLNEITSGGFFVEGSRLHLVLANFRLPVSMPYVAEQVRRDPLRPSGDTHYDLVAGAHQEVGTHYDWRLSKPLLEHPLALVSELGPMLDGPSPDREALDSGVTPEPGDPGESEVERKFRTLDRLLQKGLITQDEYARKRQELLNDL